MKKQIYITTTVPYVNAKPHIGFALELLEADALNRYYKQCGCASFLQTGTDDNALKNVKAAKEEGVTPSEWVDRNAAAFRELADALSIEYDSFIRTTEDRHKRAVYSFWNRLSPDDLYKKPYRGLYCNGCEDFYTEKNLEDELCPEHGTPVTSVEEENYFFRLSRYEKDLHTLISQDRIRIIPQKRKNEVLTFIERGLQDFSVSRSASRAGGWGIPVPGDSSQVVYVWVDALINYLSGIDFGNGSDWKKLWNEETRKIHVLGKNVWKFHAIYWPAMLLSAGFSLPDELMIHGFLTVEGKKIGKSLGNAIDPIACLDELGLDALRYFLLKGIPPSGDSDFAKERVIQLYNADLANGLGNLVSRLARLAEKSSYSPPDTQRKEVLDLPQPYHEAFIRFRIDEAVESAIDEVRALNREVDRAEPWKLLKSGQFHILHGFLRKWFERIVIVTEELKPIIPQTGQFVNQKLSDPSSLDGIRLFPRKFLA